MSTRELIDSDYAREAKARNAEAVSTLRMMRAALKNADIEKMKPLEEAEVVEVIAREVKKLKDSVESFRAGHREDLAAQVEKEIALMSRYLPAAMTEQELSDLIRTKAQAIGAATAKDFGRLMGEVAKETKGRADGSKVSAAVKQFLSS
jgi:hypothetical protein